jgi:hypothetical protein
VDDEPHRSWMLFIGGYGIVIIIITINIIIPLVWLDNAKQMCQTSLLSGNHNLFVNLVKKLLHVQHFVNGNYHI